MTEKMIEAAKDCASKIRNLTPPETKIREMFRFLAMMDRLSEICQYERPSHIGLEADSLPEDKPYEKAFKEGIYMWLDGSEIVQVCDHVATSYLEDNPVGYDAAIYFAAVFGIAAILEDESSWGYIDKTLQYLLPDGWRWSEEDEKYYKAHNDEDNYPSMAGHRSIFLGTRSDEEKLHRFDGVKICRLIIEKDPVSVKIGKRIADRLPDFGDGALQLILSELTYQDLMMVLYVLPEMAEDRIISNISDLNSPIIKGDCILYKDSVSPADIRASVLKFEAAINSYDGDPSLKAGYES